MLGNDSRNAWPKQCADKDSMRGSAPLEKSATVIYLLWKRSGTKSTNAYLKRVYKRRAGADSMRRSFPPEMCATVKHLTWKRLATTRANANMKRVYKRCAGADSMRGGVPPSFQFVKSFRYK